jgi:sortase A
MLKKVGLLIGLSVVFLGILACRIVRVERPVFDETFLAQANSGSGIPARIVAQSINLDAPVVEMGWQTKERWGQVISEWDVPEDEAAWHRNSAVPGEGGNVVISGHNNSLGGRVFANLEELTVGDQITLWNDEDASFLYQVREKKLVRVLGASQESQEVLQMVIEPTSDEQLTLITCWPNWTNTHRLIIIAAPQG